MTKRINWPVVISVLVVVVILGVLTQQAMFTRFTASKVFSLSHVLPETNADAYTFAVQDAQQRSGLFTRVKVTMMAYDYRCHAINTPENGGCERQRQFIWLTACNLICAMFYPPGPYTGFAFEYYFHYDNASTNSVYFRNPGSYVRENLLSDSVIHAANTEQYLAAFIARFREECLASEDNRAPIDLYVTVAREGLPENVVWRVQADDGACTAHFSLPDHDLAF